MTVTLSDPCHYIADKRDVRFDVRNTLYKYDTPYKAVTAITDYVLERVTAVLDRLPERPVVLLSGGVDSLLTLCAVHYFRPDLVAVTYADTSGDNNASVEKTRAEDLARYFDVEHYVVNFERADCESRMKDMVLRLKTSDVWEVLAGFILKACADTALNHGGDGALFTGGAADMLFLGGSNFSDIDPRNRETVWKDRLASQVCKDSTYYRNIPDFYTRVLGDGAGKHISLWQTLEGFDIARNIPPNVVRGSDFSTDKLILRQAAATLGAPLWALDSSKDPMQTSSGGVHTLMDLARSELTKNAQHSVYSDPELETAEFIAARLLLDRYLSLQV